MESGNSKTVLTINGEEMSFTGVDSLKSYLLEELDSWKWMREMKAFGSVSNDLYNKFVLNHISPIINKIDGGAGSEAEFVIQDIRFPFIKSDSEDGQLITKGRHEQGNVVGLFLIIYLCPEYQDLIKKSTAIKVFVEDGQYSYERAFALRLVMSNTDFGALSFDARVGSNDEIVERFFQRVKESYSALDEFEGDVKLRLAYIESTYEKRFSQIDNSLKRRVEKYKAFSSDVKADTGKKLSGAQQDLRSARDAYHDQVDLDASVQYWSNRLTTHTRAKYSWLFAIVCFMGITFFGLISYYGYGAVSGLSKSLHAVSLPLSPAPQSASSNEDGKSGDKVVEGSKSEVVSEDKILLGRTTSELSLAMADLVGAALALTLFGVLIRIGLRQFNSHSHCALDASERVTFVKTYLALLGEGKLKSDDDRRVILESLFRTSQPSAGTEIPFSSPIELILKTIGDKRV
ncbi:hypothetical protein ACAW49_03565 [Pseudomonas sp. Env-44]|uniref:hypothetical protein n=1 Tax=unclassified Pseudomonas TaxID=196821 RepID=UPI003520A83A